MVDARILVTGAAGYIGGSIVASFEGSANQRLFDTTMIASVRSAEQLQVLQKDVLHKADTEAIRLDLADELSVVATIRELKINIVIHAAASIDPTSAKSLITALGIQQSDTGIQAHFIHTSALSGFCQRTGWPEQECNDTDDVFETEKVLADSFPVRATDVAVIEHAKALKVRSYIVVPPLVYGRGTGAWNQLSVLLPVFISTALEKKKVSKFPENTRVAAVHISDLVGVYDRVIQSILAGGKIDNGERGYYFALGHDLYWHDIATKLASAMKARGLVVDEETGTWTNRDDAAEALGIPALFVEVLWNSGSNMKAHNEKRLGWKPKWKEEDFYAHIGDEIQAVVELGQAKSSLIESLRRAARG